MTHMITCIEFLLSCFQFGRFTHVCMKEYSDGNFCNQLLKLHKNKDGVYITTPAITHERKFHQDTSTAQKVSACGPSLFLCHTTLTVLVSTAVESESRREQPQKGGGYGSVGRSFVKENSGGRTVKGASASQLGPE